MVMEIIEIIGTMFIMGCILGFIGAGGSGFIIAILTIVFGFPIHTALGTSLAAMVFSTFSGTVSHFREGNVHLKTGGVVGIFSALGALIGSHYAMFIPASDLHLLTGGMLILSAFMLWLRMFVLAKTKLGTLEQPLMQGRKFWLSSCMVGLVTGTLSGAFGIGATPFIQLGLMAILGMSVRMAAGTTMMVIIPTALAGGINYYSVGYLNIPLLLEVVVGTMLGSYLGAKFTKVVPPAVLKTAMIIVPIMAGLMLLL